MAVNLQKIPLIFRVQQFKWLDKIEMASLSIKSKDLSPETKQFVVSVDTLKLNGAVMTHFVRVFW